MNLFYAPDIKSNDLLPREESHHCTKVMRKMPGEEIFIVDGKGGKYRARIMDANPKKTRVSILESFKSKEKDFKLHIALAPTKNINRFEWFLEKATEIGVDTISPIICHRSERKVIKPERLEKILVGAMKQSLKASKPVLTHLLSLENYLKNNQFPENKFIGYCEWSPPHLKDLYSNGEGATILIGPEGDFSEKEVEMAEKYGFQQISLGKSRLRTETAGVVACTIINLLNV